MCCFFWLDAQFDDLGLKALIRSFFRPLQSIHNLLRRRRSEPTLYKAVQHLLTPPPPLPLDPGWECRPRSSPERMRDGAKARTKLRRKIGTFFTYYSRMSHFFLVVLFTFKHDSVSVPPSQLTLVVVAQVVERDAQRRLAVKYAVSDACEAVCVADVGEPCCQMSALARA